MTSETPSTNQVVLTRRLLAVLALGALIWVIVARMQGPCDLWDQTQPKTVSYTTDILVHGGARWALPREQGWIAATKPPLYNWIAAPAVRVLGFQSEFGHKFPSVLALCLTWVLVLGIGCSLRTQWRTSVAWMAALASTAHYASFKLGYLARPDMLLVLWVVLMWWAGTLTLIKSRTRRSTAYLFWAAMAAAALTKGPPALLGIIYIGIAARPLAGSIREARERIRPLTGLMLFGAMVGTWIAALLILDREHAIETLWKVEIWGRITGGGPEGDPSGTWLGYLLGVPKMMFYFIVRMLPWSIPAVLGIRWVFTSRPRSTCDPDDLLKLRGAAIFCGVAIVFFGVSMGKRADYLAVAYPQAALVAAFWAVRYRPVGFGRLAIISMLTIGALVSLTKVNLWPPSEPEPGFSGVLAEFIEASHHARMEYPDVPLVPVWFESGYVQATLGVSARPSEDGLAAVIDQGKQVLVLSGWQINAERSIADWIKERYPRAGIEELVRSGDTVPTPEWPGRMSLFLVRPHHGAMQ